jgi:hypothetical protein
MKLNYAIGHYWDDTNSIGCYNYFGEVHYGTLEEARDLLKYVQEKSPDHDWKIFQLISVLS